MAKHFRAASVALLLTLAAAPVALGAGIDRHEGWWGALERIAARLAALVVAPEKDDGRAEHDGNG